MRTFFLIFFSLFFWQEGGRLLSCESNRLCNQSHRDYIKAVDMKSPESTISLSNPSFRSSICSIKKVYKVGFFFSFEESKARKNRKQEGIALSVMIVFPQLWSVRMLLNVDYMGYLVNKFKNPASRARIFRLSKLTEVHVFQFEKIEINRR